MSNPLQPSDSVTSLDPVVEATEQLTRLLDRLGDALAAVDTAALLGVESELSAVLAVMNVNAVCADGAAARSAAQTALTALDRCRRLGASFSGIARALGQRGRAVGGYDRSGGYLDRAGRSSVLVRA
jgi:hypothetical protein